VEVVTTTMSKQTLGYFLIVFAILFVNAKGEVFNDNMKDANIDDYGNWCGGGHGGFQDCCGGGPCSACQVSSGLTPQCLQQCPPIDEVDAACSKHDLCCFQYEKTINCFPQGNYCPCDCELTTDVEAATCNNLYCSGYAASLQVTFRTVLSCYWYENGGEQCGANLNNLCSHGTRPSAENL